MVNVMISSVNTAPLPERAYDADCQPASVSCRDKWQRRRFPALSLLLALLLFGGGFLLGKSSAAALPEEILPGGDTEICAGDHAVVVARAGCLKALDDIVEE